MPLPNNFVCKKSYPYSRVSYDFKRKQNRAKVVPNSVKLSKIANSVYAIKTAKTFSMIKTLLQKRRKTFHLRTHQLRAMLVAAAFLLASLFTTFLIFCGKGRKVSCTLDDWFVWDRKSAIFCSKSKNGFPYRYSLQFFLKVYLLNRSRKTTVTEIFQDTVTYRT